MTTSILPSSNLVPDKLINAKIYLEGRTDLLGTADVELPSLDYMTESITGLGLAGEIETPTIGHFQSLPFSFSWNVINEKATGLLAPKAHHLDIRASIQKYDGGTGELINKPVKVLLRGLPKKVSLGKLEPGKQMENSTELECVYVKMWIDGEVVLEIDKFNFICNINGEDALASVRSDLGMA